MKKYLLDMKVKIRERLGACHTLLRLSSDRGLPSMTPGQFVMARAEGSATTFLRRPISINLVDRDKDELWLLIAARGEGTKALCQLDEGDTLNCLLPLGNGFLASRQPTKTPLLIGGGTGVAPLLFLGRALLSHGTAPTFLLGAKTAGDLLELDFFRQLGATFITTEDASMGERGFVTDHSILSRQTFDYIATCGPKAMMAAVARYAEKRGIPCEASLENMMACGLGACLCCVEKTVSGNRCVCSEGPVFNTNDLLWRN